MLLYICLASIDINYHLCIRMLNLKDQVCARQAHVICYAYGVMDYYFYYNYNYDYHYIAGPSNTGGVKYRDFEIFP